MTDTAVKGNGGESEEESKEEESDEMGTATIRIIRTTTTHSCAHPYVRVTSRQYVGGHHTNHTTRPGMGPEGDTSRIDTKEALDRAMAQFPALGAEMKRLQQLDKVDKDAVPWRDLADAERQVDITGKEMALQQKRLDGMPAILDFDETFDFHVNENSHEFMFTAVDSYDLDSEAMGTALLALDQLKACESPTNMTLPMEDSAGKKIGEITVVVFYSSVAR
jgi:hypothetical protein